MGELLLLGSVAGCLLGISLRKLLLRGLRVSLWSLLWSIALGCLLRCVTLRGLLLDLLWVSLRGLLGLRVTLWEARGARLWRRRAVRLRVVLLLLSSGDLLRLRVALRGLGSVALLDLLRVSLRSLV